MVYAFQHGDRPLDGYVIQRAVGQGGFGEVYYALSDGGREVALKYLRNNPEIELRGVTQCMNLKSPHLVTIFDVKKGPNDDYFIIMEYISGPSLRDLLLAEPKGLGVPKTAYFLKEIAKGLKYLHERGIVHRDLKPGNILYDDGCVKIGDYGLSKFLSMSRHSLQTSTIGSVHYMAPEVGSGHYTQAVDIYALGVILYEMLVGKVPFEGSSMGEVLMKHLTAQPMLDELPRPFPDVIRKALAKDPADRFASVQEMIEAAFADEDIERSLLGFDERELSMVAARTAERLRLAAPKPRATVRSGSENPLAKEVLPQGSSAGAIEATSSPANDAAIASRRNQARTVLIIGVAATLAISVLGTLTQQPGPAAVAAVVAASMTSLLVLKLGGTKERKCATPWRSRPTRARKLQLPIRRSLFVDHIEGLGARLERYFLMLGYRLAKQEDMSWQFERGKKSETWSSDIRDYHTKLNIAVYEEADRYRLLCLLDVKNPWGWTTQKEIRLLAADLDGFEEILTGASKRVARDGARWESDFKREDHGVEVS